MRTIKRAWLTSLVLATAAVAGGCGFVTHLDGANTKGVDSTSAAAQQTSPQMATPYNQPLMATGGDLAMVRFPRGVAGTSLAC